VSVSAACEYAWLVRGSSSRAVRAGVPLRPGGGQLPPTSCPLSRLSRQSSSRLSRRSASRRSASRRSAVRQAPLSPRPASPRPASARLLSVRPALSARLRPAVAGAPFEPAGPPKPPEALKFPAALKLPEALVPLLKLGVLAG